MAETSDRYFGGTSWLLANAGKSLNNWSRGWTLQTEGTTEGTPTLELGKARIILRASKIFTVGPMPTFWVPLGGESTSSTLRRRPLRPGSDLAALRRPGTDVRVNAAIGPVAYHNIVQRGYDYTYAYWDLEWSAGGW